MDHLFSGGTPGFRNHMIIMKCKQCNDVSTLAQKYSSVFKKTAVNSTLKTNSESANSCQNKTLIVPDVGRKLVFDNIDYCHEVHYMTEEHQSVDNHLASSVNNQLEVVFLN